MKIMQAADPPQEQKDSSDRLQGYCYKMRRYQHNCYIDCRLSRHHACQPLSKRHFDLQLLPRQQAAMSGENDQVNVFTWVNFRIVRSVQPWPAPSFHRCPCRSRRCRHSGCWRHHRDRGVCCKRWRRCP